MTDEEPNTPIRDIADNSYISFYIKAKDTEENAKVHEWFKEFARKFTGNDYTQALRLIRDLVAQHKQLTSFWDKLHRQEERIDALEQHLAQLTIEDTDEEETKDEEGETF